MPQITSCLWFDTEGEDAAKFYTSVFPNSKITHVARYGEAGPGEAGTVMTVSFELDGQKFVALNGGPEFTFSEAISFQVDCESQDEVDHYWSAARRRRRGRPVRLAEGPVRRLLADRPDAPARAARPIRTGRSPSGSCRRCCRCESSTSTRSSGLRRRVNRAC